MTSRLEKQQVERVDEQTIEQIYKKIIGLRTGRDFVGFPAYFLTVMLFFEEEISESVLSSVLFCMMFWIIFIFWIIKDISIYRRVKNRPYTIHKGVFCGKEIISGDNVETEYRVKYYFEDLSYHWSADVYEHEYQIAGEGDTAYLALFEKNKPHKAFIGFYEIDKKLSVYMGYENPK